MRAWLSMAACVAVLATLIGCANQSTMGGELAERVTASDQSDAERRARVRLELASAYFARGQVETALDELKLSINAKPDLAEAYSLRGLIYASLGDAALAEASFRRALQLNPRDADTLHNFGWVQCQAQRYADAAALFEQAMAQPQYRGVARTLLAKGLCQARAGQWLDAEISLLRSYELDPTNASTALNLSEVLYRRADYERARFYIGRVNSQPISVNAQTLWLSARIEHKLGNPSRVRELGAQLRDRFPQAPETTLYETGRFDG